MTTTDPQRDPAAVFTRAAWTLLAYAERIDLRPEIGPVYRGAVRVRLNAEGVDCGFGRLEIGARAGRVLRIYLQHGNDDPRHDPIST